jgi:hypothetical protein
VDGREAAGILQHEARTPLGVARGEGDRGRAADRVADDDARLDVERVERGPSRLGVVRRGPGRGRRAGERPCPGQSIAITRARGERPRRRREVRAS